MAKAMVTLTWCDIHLELDEQVPGQPMPELDGYQLDLCAICAEPIAAARKLYQDYGSKGARTIRPPKGSVQQLAAVEPTHACPVCQKHYKNRGSLAAHVRTQHETSLQVVEGKPATVPCETCGGMFATQQALQMHQRKHAREQAAVKPARKRARKSA